MHSNLSCRYLVALMIVALAAGWADLAVGQARGVTVQGRAAILAAPATAFDGAKFGDQIVVEYLDFNCPYCKRQAISLKQLIAAEPRAKVLYKDWPIFGGVSAYAARAVLAAEWQGRYLAAHDGLISAPSRLSSTDQVREALKMAGVRLDRLDRDLNIHGAEIEAVLARNANEARLLGFTGTPGLVVGSFVIPGAVPLETLQKALSLSAGTRQ